MISTAKLGLLAELTGWSIIMVLFREMAPAIEYFSIINTLTRRFGNRLAGTAEYRLLLASIFGAPRQLKLPRIISSEIE